MTFLVSCCWSLVDKKKKVTALFLLAYVVLGFVLTSCWEITAFEQFFQIWMYWSSLGLPVELNGEKMSVGHKKGIWAFLWQSNCGNHFISGMSVILNAHHMDSQAKTNFHNFGGWCDFDGGIIAMLHRQLFSRAGKYWRVCDLRLPSFSHFYTHTYYNKEINSKDNYNSCFRVLEVHSLTLSHSASSA